MDQKATVETWMDAILDRNETCQRNLGDFLAKLLSWKLLKANDLGEAMKFIATDFEDIQCNVPNLVSILANILERFLINKRSNIRFFSKIFPLIARKDSAAKCVNLIKEKAAARIEQDKVDIIFRTSGL